MPWRHLDLLQHQVGSASTIPVLPKDRDRCSILASCSPIELGGKLHLLPMENVWKAGTTMSDVEELGKLDAQHQAGTDRDTEFAAEQAKLLDEILASADLGSPVTPEVRSIDETSDAELSHDEGRAALAAPPGQPQGQAVSVSEAAYDVPAFVGPMFTGTTTPGEDGEVVALDAAHQAGTGSDIESGAEEAKQLEETPAGAELGSPVAPEVRSIDETGDGELSDDEGRVALAFPPGQPQEQAVTVWPVAYSAPISTAAPFTDTTTPGEDGEAVELEAAHQAGTGTDTEAAGEEAKQLDETAAGAELGSPGMPEVVSIDETGDGELSHDEGRAALASPPGQPLGQAVTAWPGAYGVPAFAGPLFTGFTTLAKDEAVALDAAHQAGTGSDTEPAGEEAKLEETPALVELDSPGTPEDRPVEETSDAGTPPDQEQAEPAPAAGQPAEEAVTVRPGAYSPPASAAAPTTDTTTKGEDVEDVEAVALEAAPQAGTAGDAEPAAEEANQHEEPPAVVELDSPATAEVRPVDEVSDTETAHDQEQAEPAPAAVQPGEEAATVEEAASSAPASAAAAFADTTTMLGETRKSRRRSPALVAILAAVFLVAALGAGFVAVKQTTATRQWRQRDQNEVALNRGLSAREGVLSNDLASTNATITFLNSQTSKLNGQVKSLQTQLSAVAAANRKALNHNGLLTQLTNQAGTVSNELAMCVGDVSSLRTEIDSDLSKPSYKDARLQPNMHIANQVCATARQDGQQLQSALRGA